MEVGPLSRGVILLLAQPLSVPLQNSLRFFHLPLPAVPSACLATHLPGGRTTGLPRSAYLPLAGSGSACPPRVLLSTIEEGEPSMPTPCLLAQAYQRLWLGGSHDVYQQFAYANHAISILAPDHLGAGSRGFASRFHRRRTGEVSLSQELLHSPVAQAAHPGRIPVVEHRVASCLLRSNR